MSLDLLDLTLLAPPFAFGEGDEAPAPTDDFRTALRNRLVAAEGLEPLGERIFWAKTGTAPLPNLRIFRIGPDRRMENTVDGGPFERRLQFSILSEDDVEAEELAEAAHAALEWDATDPLLFVGGYEMARFPEDLAGLPDETPGDGPGGVDVWHSHFDVTFLMGRR